MRAAALLFALVLGGPAAEARKKNKAVSLYDVKGTIGVNGEPLALSSFAGDVSLVVNVASQ